MGEFGRTPEGQRHAAGRDHWNFCYSLLLAGGGIKGGYVHGASDKIGAQPSRNPVTPGDIDRHDLPVPRHRRTTSNCATASRGPSSSAPGEARSARS